MSGTVRNNGHRTALSSSAVCIFDGWVATRLLVSLTCLVGSVWGQDAQPDDPFPRPLRARIERLKREVAVVETSSETIQSRTSVLWDWANAYAIRGGQLPVNLPAVVAQVRSDSDPASTGTTRRYAKTIDSYVRQMQVYDERPHGIGPLECDNTGPFVANSYQTIRQTYKIGSMALEPGGGILVARHFISDHGRVQPSSPSADNYITIAASNPQAKFRADQVPLAGMHGGFRGATDRLFFRLEGDTLVRGDTVTVTYGDRSGGSRGFKVQSYSNDAFQLPLYVDFDGQGDLFMLPLVAYKVVGQGVRGVHGFAPSVVKVGEPFEVSVRSEDQFRNRATGAIPAYQVLLNGKLFRSIPPGDEPITILRDITLDTPGIYRFSIRSEDGAVTGVANPIWVRRDAKTKIYWGDTHGHCGFAEGQGTPDGFFQFGRDDARLDFLTHSEHDIWMDDREWQTLKDNVEKYNNPGNFVAILGYEWTAPHRLGGHHNVFFRTPGDRDRVPRQEAPVLSELYRRLATENDMRDVLIIPHAHQPGDYRHSHPHMETLVEIMSMHGRFEWFGRMYLQHGHEVGFVAASDDHLSHPGYSSPLARGLRDNSGLAAVLAPEKTNDAIFDALKSLAAYATSGERILLDVDLNGAMMGQRTTFAEKRRIHVRVVGTAPIDSVTIVKNGKDLWTKDYLTAPSESSSRYLLSFASPTDPVVRDNPRGWRQWTGTVSVQGARLSSFSAPALRNPRSDVIGNGSHANEIRFDTATRGSEKGIVMELSGTDADTEVSVNLEPNVEVTTTPARYRGLAKLPAAELRFRVAELQQGRAEHKLHVDRHTDIVSLRRIVAAPPMDVQFDYTDAESPEQGDYYYVRATQIDGGMAWSSPIWVGGYSGR